jgi:hypothetical protein
MDDIATSPLHINPKESSDDVPSTQPPASAALQESRAMPFGSITEQASSSPSDLVEVAQSPVDMGPLSIRGKGSYTCDYGTECKKGGVQATGELVIFERNCAFR